MDATVLATIQRLATGANPNIHTFVQGQNVPQQTFASSDSASRHRRRRAVGTKFRLMDFHAGGLAAAADVRLPTGDEENLLGGSTQDEGVSGRVRRTGPA